MRPGEEDSLRGLEAEAARLQGELAKIESLSNEAACRLCGVRTNLSDEHTPSKKAGNIGKMIRGAIDYASSITRGTVLWKWKPIQGVKREALCEPCNNRTGSWYNPAYLRFVRHCRDIARPEKAGEICQLGISLHRQRVAKQALTSVVASSQPGFTTRYPELRRLLLEREERQPIAPIRLWLYLRANPGGVSTGLTIAVDTERRRGNLVAGFSFWPLGWIVTIGDVTVTGAANVSGWTELDYHDKAPATIEVPCQWALSPYAGDFRGPEDFGGGAWGAKPLR